MMENFSNKYSKSSNKLDICDTPSKSSPFSVPLEKEQFQVAFYQIYELEPNSISMWDIIKKQKPVYLQQTSQASKGMLLICTG